jgi:hypothetical protein
MTEATPYQRQQTDDGKEVEEVTWVNPGISPKTYFLLFGTASEGMLEDIAEGLPMAERKLAFAVQGQSYGPMFDEKLTVADCKTKQSWAIISTKDRMLPPAMEESAARRMGAVTTTVETCHMSILQEPAGSRQSSTKQHERRWRNGSKPPVSTS